MRRTATILLLGLTGLISSYSQTSATVKMDHGEVTAGETIPIVATFDQPATCTQTARIYMTGPVLSDGSQAVLDFRGTLATGQNTATLTVTIPKDYQGQFNTVASNSVLFPCDGYSTAKHFSAPPLTLNVTSIPDPNKYPSKAGVALSLSQKQFLATKIAALNDLSSQIDTRVEENGDDLLLLRDFLAGIVEKAEADLGVTERQYRTELLKPTDTLPAFFADFRRQYAALHDELKAPIPGTRADAEQPARLVYVQQLQRRQPSAPPMKGRNLSGVTPAIAKAVKETVDDNASAYGIVNSTGRATFHAEFTSFPKGATLYYRQAILPDFQIYSSLTDIPSADFDLATFVFKFHKDECKDEPVRTIDPYSDPSPNVSVEFKQCSKR
jgi:hypothetical protein